MEPAPGFIPVPDEPKKRGKTLFVLAGVFGGLGMVLGLVALLIVQTRPECAGGGFECFIENLVFVVFFGFFAAISLAVGVGMLITAVVLAIVGAANQANQS